MRSRRTYLLNKRKKQNWKTYILSLFRDNEYMRRAEAKTFGNIVNRNRTHLQEGKLDKLNEKYYCKKV